MQLNAPGDRRLDRRVAVVTGAAKEHGMTCRTILVEGGGSMW
jgi:hypothetical protein